ncbi:MAG: vitamin K epoxide reductase family protein [Chloroflexi bacterium]|nr:MAG: vitamin K epoxide reductase family protein [Chloroflexota bacterium]
MYMAFLQRSGGQLVLFALSLLGIAISIYLTTVHYQNVPLVCSTQGFVDCERVLSSPFSVVPGTSLPITIPGLLWFMVSGSLAFVSWRFWPDQRNLRIAELLWIVIGMLTVLYLVYVEIVRLHTLCAWCTAVHVIMLLMLLLALVQWQRPEEGQLEEQDEEPSSAPIMRK